MKLQQYSVRGFLKAECIGLLFFTAVMLGMMYLMTENFTAVVCGLLLAAVFFAWGIFSIRYFQRKLSSFTEGLCRTLDGMIDGNERPKMNYEAETLLARISHRLERLYQIMQENSRKVKAEKAELQSLVSDISHQTKMPIANLKMLNDTMLTRPLTKEKQQEFLRAAKSQLEKLEFMIQAMVKTSRLETGVIVLEKKAVPVSETIAAAVNGVLALLEKKQISLSFDGQEDAVVLHDSRWTTEALFNILDNAVKYTPEQGHISITVQEWELYLKIDVADSGRGISESEHAAVFKRFYREEAVHDIEGIGIGLYLAREIITMQGGYIKVVSKPGRGAVFSVFLPRK